MEEAISLIIRGCKLAKDLESMLPSLQIHQDQTESRALAASKLCDIIVNTFTAAKERLVGNPNVNIPTYPQQMDAASLQEWVRTNINASPMDQWLQMQLAATGNPSGLLEAEAAMRLPVDVPANTNTDTNPAGRLPPPHARPRPRRKDDAVKLTVRVSAPQMGNTEIPPEDGFTWRKYGQKEILAARFPRGYYRCTHQKLYSCPAKKQVQRLDDDPNTFEITYRGEHTCHKTATAPSVPPPAPTASQHHALIGAPAGWLGFSLGGGGDAGGGSSTGGAGASTSGTVRPPREIPDLPVADLADAMFNSGTSGGNSMEFIFSAQDRNKWDPMQRDEQDE